MKKFSQTIGVGWGVAGPVTSGIRGQAKRLGLTLEPLPFGKAGDPVLVVPVVVEGDDAAVDLFAEYMARHFPDGP